MLPNLWFYLTDVEINVGKSQNTLDLVFANYCIMYSAMLLLQQYSTAEVRKHGNVFPIKARLKAPKGNNHTKQQQKIKINRVKRKETYENYFQRIEYYTRRPNSNRLRVQMLHKTSVKAK